MRPQKKGDLRGPFRAEKGGKKGGEPIIAHESSRARVLER